MDEKWLCNVIQGSAVNRTTYSPSDSKYFKIHTITHTNLFFKHLHTSQQEGFKRERSLTSGGKASWSNLSHQLLRAWLWLSRLGGGSIYLVITQSTRHGVLMGTEGEKGFSVIQRIPNERNHLQHSQSFTSECINFLLHSFIVILQLNLSVYLHYLLFISA